MKKKTNINLVTLESIDRKIDDVLKTTKNSFTHITSEIISLDNKIDIEKKLAMK